MTRTTLEIALSLAFEWISEERNKFKIHTAEEIAALGVEWRSNTHDPNHRDFKLSIWRGFDESHEHALESTLHWLNLGVLGPPQKTDTFTVEQLTRMGYVGYYRKPEAR